MVGARSRNQGRGKAEGDDGNRADYEESRAQRIKENMERMKSLGIVDLSKQLKRRPTAKPSLSLRKTKSTAAASSSGPPRRSYRLKDMPPVSYSEKKIPKKETSAAKNVVIHIPQGENPEIYTQEHEKLLGDSTAVWELGVDGRHEDGSPMYDPHQGKSCHQCRQKTLGLRTNCYKCQAVTGQFCGDCLYTRYGENVAEANLKSDWLCPVCRGICNCSRCRRNKGWAPTGVIYKEVKKLGYKSVAHYLIYTQRGQAKTEVAAAVSPISADGSLAIDDKKEGSSDAITQQGAEKNEMAEDNLKVDSDEEFRGDDYEDEEEEEESQ